MCPTAPRPIPGVKYKSTFHRIRVHVVQLFLELLLAPDVEVVKAPLPEMLFFRSYRGEFEVELALWCAFSFFPE